MRHEKYAANNLTTKGEKKNNNCNTLRTNSNIWKNSLSSTWLENYSIKKNPSMFFDKITFKIQFKTSVHPDFNRGNIFSKKNIRQHHITLKTYR